jgi:hypothetical protein
MLTLAMFARRAPMFERKVHEGAETPAIDLRTFPVDSL